MKKIITIILLSLTSLSASAADKSINDIPNTAAWYKVYWTGLHIADLRAEITDDSFETVIESYGLVRKISKYSSKAHTKFSTKNNQFLPTVFHTKAQHRRGSRTIDIKYNNGKIIYEAVVPPDSRPKRPAVDDKLKRGSVDPLTAYLIARQKIKQSLSNGQKEFNFKMYDGRRLSNLNFKIEGREQREIVRKQYDVLKIIFKREPIAGFTNNELRRMKGEEPTFTIYATADERLLPIKADAEAPLGQAVLLLQKECESIQSCY